MGSLVGSDGDGNEDEDEELGWRVSASIRMELATVSRCSEQTSETTGRLEFA